MQSYPMQSTTNNTFLYIEHNIATVMFIYEVVYKTEDGSIDHQVVTDSSVDSVRENWDSEREGNDTIVAVEEHGKFRSTEVYEAVKEDIYARGVQEKHMP